MAPLSPPKSKKVAINTNPIPALSDGCFQVDSKARDIPCPLCPNPWPSFQPRASRRRLPMPRVCASKSPILVREFPEQKKRLVILKTWSRDKQCYSSQKTGMIPHPKNKCYINACSYTLSSTIVTIFHIQNS